MSPSANTPKSDKGDDPREAGDAALVVGPGHEGRADRLRCAGAQRSQYVTNAWVGPRRPPRTRKTLTVRSPRSPTRVVWSFASL